MSAKKTKLPKRIWVVEIGGTGGLDVSEGFSLTRSYAMGAAEPGDRVHAYAPVQPPRRCVWTHQRFRYYNTQCGRSLPIDEAITYCTDCGGKIKVAK